MREALNDITNAITLVTIKLSDSLFGVGFDVVKLPTTQDNKREDTDLDTDQSNNIYCINLHLLRAYILNCFGRKSEALQECNLALDFDLKSRENDSSFASSHTAKCYTLKAAISQRSEDAQLAMKVDTEHRLMLFPPLGQEDLLSIIIYLCAAQSGVISNVM